MSLLSGLKMMNPTSVNYTGSGSGTTTANGYVSFTNTPSIKLNGVFNSNYTNYYIIFKSGLVGTGYVDIRAQLCISGSPSTSFQYVSQTTTANGTTITGLRSVATDSFNIGMSASTAACCSEIYLFAPFATTSTAMLSQAVHAYDSIYLKDYAGTHNNTSSHDGILFYLDTGTMTGNVAVFGFNE